MKRPYITISIASFIALLVVACSPAIGIIGEVHEHAGLKIYIGGNPINFSHDKYMSSENMTLSNFIHLHDKDGEIIHKHTRGITLGFFFESLNMKFDSQCLAIDTKNGYCSENSKKLKMYVNGKQNYKYENYEFNDLDRILITYGSESAEQIKAQIESVTDEACIYSEKCLERGSPPDESSCIGSGCEVE